MALLTVCPVPTAITTPPVPTCIRDFGQITKLVFQRTYSSGTTVNSFTISSADPAEVASWDTFFDASDGTKAIISPYIENSLLEGADPDEYGGGDATAFGIAKIVSLNPTSFSGEFHQQRQDVAEALKTLQSEVLSVYLVNEYGQLGGIADSLSSPTTFKGIPIHPGTFYVSDLVGGRRSTPDMNMIRFKFRPNWSDKFHVVVPSDFNGNELS